MFPEREWSAVWDAMFQDDSVELSIIFGNLEITGGLDSWLTYFAVIVVAKAWLEWI